jgi:hypothetical protein
VVVVEKMKIVEISMDKRVGQLLEEFADSEPSQRALVERVSCDNELEKLLFNRVSSSYYAISTGINYVARAVGLLGVTGVISPFEDAIGERVKVA